MRIFTLLVVAYAVLNEGTKGEESELSALKYRKRFVSQLFPTTSTEGPWTGRWLPERTTANPLIKHITTSNPLFSYEIPFDPRHGVAMGIPASGCDDAKTNLEIDWNYSPINYTCYNPGYKYKPNRELLPLIEMERIPPLYVARHICMDKPISYDRPIPTFGEHRPLWPRYGEYKFVPVQRWIHNLEHGGVVMLYHPCANPIEVNRLRKVVKSCLRRYIITPHTMMDEQRPMALVVWGWRMTMSTVDSGAVREFISKKALHGPEKLSKDGQFDLGLQVPSEVVQGSNFNDDVLCPSKH
ncbi:uncharacterized protein [Hetaerina americana]|uniref:uncharacterized protein n=1 Tax=Hetaerina americana TaxID=62018 RepID=UPI003A7F585B